MMYQSTRDPSHKSIPPPRSSKWGLPRTADCSSRKPSPRSVRRTLKRCGTRAIPFAPRASCICSPTDYTQEELMTDCHAAYREASFPGGAAPLVHVCNNLYALELWHGPTAAFKDMALQIMPRLLSRALVKLARRAMP